MTTTESNTAGAVSLKVLAERKIEGIQKTTQFQVDPHKIEVEPGFNARPIDPEHVRAMKTSMLAGSILPPLFVRVDNGRIIMVDGHHRLTAIRELIDEGHEIKRVDVVQFRGNDADRISHMLTSAQGKALTPLQMGVQYRKLTAFGWTEREIGDKVGKTRQHVHDMVFLAESNSDVQGMVARGEVAAHIAIDALRKHGSEAGNVLAGHLDTAKAAGKSKVTNKTIRKSAPVAVSAGLCADFLAPKHTGMMISAEGILGRIRDGRYYHELNFGCGEMLRHMEEMAERFYSGDIKAVDEFLQLYQLDDAREKSSGNISENPELIKE